MALSAPSFLRQASSGNSPGYSSPEAAPTKGDMTLFNDPAALAEMNNSNLLRAQRSSNNNKNGGSVSFGNVQQASTNNGNPEYLKGEATLTMPDGTILNVPNAFAQQMMFTQSWNQGRANVGEDYLGTSTTQKAINEGQQVNYDAANQRLQQFNAANPYLTSGSGLVGAAGAALQRKMDIDRKIQALKAEMSGRPMTEQVSVSGQSTSGNYNSYQSSMEALKREQQQANTEDTESRRWYNTRQDEQNMGANIIGRVARLISPTTSNLKISETLIK